MKIRIFQDRRKVLVVIVSILGINLILAYVWPTLLLVMSAMFELAFAGIGVLLILSSLSREFKLRLTRPERILVLAPHQDDCAIMAGALLAKNSEFGGMGLIVYLSQSSDQNIRNMRLNECRDAWDRWNGICLIQLDLLPPIYSFAPSRCREATEPIQRIIDNFSPTIIVVPHFEGGHKHHDITWALVTFRLRFSADVLVLEAPLYSPMLSTVRTPLKCLKYVLKTMTLGIVSYYPPAEGIHGGQTLVFECDGVALQKKKQLLLCFKSQNGESLSRSFGYPDRFIRWMPVRYQCSPFNFIKSAGRLIEWLSKPIPAFIVNRIIPGMWHTHGLSEGITNLDREFDGSPANSFATEDNKENTCAAHTT